MMNHESLYHESNHGVSKDFINHLKVGSVSIKLHHQCYFNFYLS